MKNLYFLKSAFLVIAFLTAVPVFSQSAKKQCEVAEKFVKGNNYEGAIEAYTKAIELDPNYFKAYSSRAECYEKLNKKDLAIEDYKKAIAFTPKEKELYYKAGVLMVDLQKYAEADQMFRKAIERDKSYTEAIEAEVKVLFILRDYNYGLVVNQLAIDDKKTAINYYNQAVFYDSLKNYTEAEKFYKSSKSVDSKFIPGYVGMALAEVKLNKPDEALANCNAALLKDPNSLDVFYAKSLAHAGKKDYQNAINEITKVIISRPSPEVFKIRASYYETLGQYHNAINDYTQVIKLDDKNQEAYLKRAAAYEFIGNYKAALTDYNKVALQNSGQEKIEVFLKQAKAKIFELSRESAKPEVEIVSLKPVKNTVKIAANKDEITVTGKVRDESMIKNMTVNAGTVKFSGDSLNPTFVAELSGVIKLNEIIISATDVYNNTQTVQYKIEKTECDKPIIAIETPITSFENEIFIDNTNTSEVFLQGTIKDASLIESIIIDGVTASFNPSNLNPDFSTQLKIAEKSKVAITVKDIYGNENTQIYTLNRTAASAGIDNPMGNTWVVFIENSKYQNFPSLEGPAKDVTAMRSALANYKVTNIIHKKDMTKSQMEKFFSIELRDYVKNNNINSLMVWYAGHGKYVSPTGYWVPADGKTDDEFSYFGINNLKAAMQSYSDKLIHTLVITDACESGATFLMAMRGGDDEKRCDNFELTKAKSSQVFTSAGYELASDNSQFTKTFSATLNNNVEMCLPIEKIVKKVNSAVVAAGNQSPKFGKIKDLADEGGTFFFIRK
ncbi:MAG: tetratricopeptide repeat protein [Bacteroidia bacterium]|jgi:tetratricopeptide (TPR) repeat protein|nr:tetratricopeptide repeat protein [Bacteroidia bacterium]